MSYGSDLVRHLSCLHQPSLRWPNIFFMSNDGDGLGLDEAPFEEVLADGFDSGFGHKEAFM
ncbi:hypothetical protein S245_013888, partial [Arachis hypogaea]